ncbi:hypothetical protein T02_3184 [Trichinella nativa]|uniref:CCHC-type domain-containing protein n=1 Tax=Trichinella nativa TaxID=6335 RepID=A0A0V1LI53_9BILA|nr:hypothetical protein T02_3184 [Trichinella nativa]
MKAVLNCVLFRDPDVRKGTSAYIDDILVNESVVAVDRVKRHLAHYGLTCKTHERAADGARLLGLKVWGERGKLMWRRDNGVLTRRSVFSYCGKLVSHIPVCGWLRIATAYIKRKANDATTSWDEVIDGDELRRLIHETALVVKKRDPARGRWDVSAEEAKIWVDANSLAIGVALEVGGSMVEDAAWLRPDDAQYINMAELDAVIKGLNLAISWQMRRIRLMTDSATVHRWVMDGLSGKEAMDSTKQNSKFLELEYRKYTVGGSRGRVRDLDLEVRSERLGLAALIFDSIPVKCENLSQAIAAMCSGNGVHKSLDLRLIPEFDGSPQQSVVEWLEKVELVCKLRDISDVASVIPLRLTGGAFAVYLQLNAQERSSIDKVKEALLAAFATDPFVAYDQFVSRKLGPDESPDVFLAELRRLATLFGGVSEKALACAFVAGLPENVRQQLRVRSRMGYLGLSQILTRARAIITDERPVDAPNTCLSARGPGVQSPTAPPGQRCFECGRPNHFARDCLARRQGGDPGKRARDRGISASLLSPRPLTEALPAVRMNVGGIRRRVLVDTGCTVCVAHASYCRSWRKEDVAITTMCGRAMGCEGTGVVQLRPHGKGPIEVEVIVVRSKPVGYDLILGMNGIAALGGVMVSGGRCVRFGLNGPGVCAATEAGISIREKDFTATHCPSTRSWTAAWKWSDAGEPGVLRVLL